MSDTLHDPSRALDASPRHPGAQTSPGVPAHEGPPGPELTYRPRRKLPPAPPAWQGMVASIYARYSYLTQHVSSIERQYALCADHAARISASIVARYADEAKSGMTTLGRDGLERMLQDAEAGKFNLLLIEDVTRIGRDGEDIARIWDRLHKAKVAVHEANGTVLDPTSLAIKALLAQKERETSLSRMKEGRAHAVSSGKMMYAPVYGFCRDPERAKKHVPHPERIEVVKSIFDAVLAGKRPSEIAADLTGREPTPRDCRLMATGKLPPGTMSPWSGNMVRYVVMNTAYVGVVVDRRREVLRDPANYLSVTRVTHSITNCLKVLHKPLVVVTKADWETVQGLISEKCFRTKPLAPRNGYLLAKKVFCGCCGAALRIVKCETLLCPTVSEKCGGTTGRLSIATLEGALFALLADEALADVEAIADCGGNAGSGFQAEPADQRQALSDELERIRRDLRDAIGNMPFGAAGAASRSAVGHVQALEERAQDIEGRLLALPHRVARCEPDAGDVWTALKALVRDEPASMSDASASWLLQAVRAMTAKVSVTDSTQGYSIQVALDSGASHAGARTARTLATWVPRATEDLAWLRRQVSLEGPKKGAARTRADAAIADTVRAVLAGMADGFDNPDHPRLSGVLRCLEGLNSMKVAQDLCTDERNVLAWLHVARAKGPERLLGWPAPTGELRHGMALDWGLIDFACADLKSKVPWQQVNHFSHLRAIRRYLAGRSLGESALEIRGRGGIRPIVAHIDLFEKCGFEEYRITASKLKAGPEHVDYLKRMIEQGCDPIDPAKPLNIGGLTADFNRTFGSTYKPLGLRHMMTRQGLRISDGERQPLNARQREVRAAVKVVAALPID